MKNKTKKQFIKYLFTGGCVYCITVSVYWFFVDTLHYPARYVAMIYGISITLIRFLINKYWVYNK